MCLCVKVCEKGDLSIGVESTSVVLPAHHLAAHARACHRGASLGRSGQKNSYYSRTVLLSEKEV